MLSITTSNVIFFKVSYYDNNDNSIERKSDKNENLLVIAEGKI